MSLKLLKVTLQPTFVEIDGEGEVIEHQGQTITVPGKSWSDFASHAFGPDEMAALEAQIEAQRQSSEDPHTD